jgi:SAM-dependent methyltransferase
MKHGLEPAFAKCPKCEYQPAIHESFKKVPLPSDFPSRDHWQNDPEHLNTLEFYAWFLTFLREGRVLDLGSGPGTVAIPLHRLDSVAELVCFDVDPAARRALVDLKTKLELPKLCISGETGAPHALPFEAESFDAVICRYAMHHFPDQGGALRELHRCLRNDGLLLYSDPPMPVHSRDSTDQLYRRREGDFHGYRTYHEMIDMVTRHGFRILAVRPYDYQRGTLDLFLKNVAEPALKEELIEGWLGLDDQTKRELRWSGLREGPFITYPIVDIAAKKNT